MNHLAIISVSLFAIACTTSAAETPDAMIDAAPPAFSSTAVSNLGGPVLDTPEVITITWPDDPLASALQTFDAWWVSSDVWITALTQYGVHAGTATSWTVPTAAPATLDDSAIQTLLHDAIQAGTLAAPTPSTVYTMYMPAGTAVTETVDTVVYTSCVAFGGYHSMTTLDDGTPVYYAVIPRCPSQLGTTLEDEATWAGSHELAEAATDPSAIEPAWRIPYDPTQPWLTAGGGEIGDLCTENPTTLDGYQINTLYSNAAAIAGQRPCVPAPPGPMYSATAHPPELALEEGSGADLIISIAASQADVPGLTLQTLSYPAGVTITPAAAPVSAGAKLPIHVALRPGTPPGLYEVVLELSDSTYPVDSFLMIEP